MKKVLLLLWACLTSTLLFANHWEPENSGNYAFVMGVNSVIEINGVEQYSDQLELGAFCGTECRGSQMAIQFPLTGRYLAQISIYGEVGHEITFKLYDHNTEQEVGICSTMVTFTNDGYGTPIVPLALNFVTPYEITVSANPTTGGTVSGGGSYNAGETATVVATPRAGYSFVSWTENSNVVSTSATYSFVVTESRALVANFQAATANYTISASANPSNGGTVSGAGTYAQGSTCTLRAIPASGYVFVNWTKNGNVVSTSSTYSFTVNASASYVANFEQQGQMTFHFTPVPEGQYANSCTIVGVVIIDDVEQYSSMLELGIYCGEECRGTNFAEDFFITHRFLFFVNVYGENGNELTFKLYDHSIGEELDLTPPASVFFREEGYGNPMEPYELYFTSVVEISASVDPADAGIVSGTGDYAIGATCTLTATANPGFEFKNWTLNDAVVSTIPTFTFTVTEEANYVAHFSFIQNNSLVSGWNWWSSYIEQSGINGLQMLENSLGSFGIRIQGKNASTDYFEYQGTGYWYGALNAITNEQMYKIRTSAACTAELVGDLALAESHPITLNSGWSWIGFLSNQPVDINTALSGITPEPNDIIKGRNGSATYISYNEYHLWYGQLNTLQPGQGYMYMSNSATPKTLVYQSGRENVEVKPNITPETNVYVPADADYADNMLITAVVEMDGVELRSEEYELAAFAGDECRGSVKLMYIEPLDRYVAFLLVFGEDSENLHFVLTDGTEMSLSDDFVLYEIDGIVGTLTEPVTLHFGPLGMEDGMQMPVSVYPNPSKDVFNIEGIGLQRVEVINTYGQVIFSSKVENNFQQIDLSEKANGAYLLRIITNNGITTKKLIKN